MSETPHTDTLTDDGRPLYGWLAEFSSGEELVAQAKRVRAMGYTAVEGYSPYPVDGLAEAVGFTKNRISMITLMGGLFGGGLAYFMLYYVNVIDYPLNVGGRPFHSWPAFIPITFELTVLFASFATVIGLFALNGFPRPYHPVFNVDRFERASQDGFFLSVEATDPCFDREKTYRDLVSLRPKNVYEVPA